MSTAGDNRIIFKNSMDGQSGKCQVHRCYGTEILTIAPRYMTLNIKKFCTFFKMLVKMNNGF